MKSEDMSTYQDKSHDLYSRLSIRYLSIDLPRLHASGRIDYEMWCTCKQLEPSLERYQVLSGIVSYEYCKMGYWTSDR